MRYIMRNKSRGGGDLGDGVVLQSQVQVLRVAAALALPVAPLTQIRSCRTGALEVEDVEVDAVQDKLIKHHYKSDEVFKLI